MKKYVHNLNIDEIVNIDNNYFKVNAVQAVFKTKRRYEKSVWYPKEAGYDSYNLSLINVFTKEYIHCIHDAETQFKIINPIVTKYYVVEINNNTTIKKYVDDNDIGEIIIRAKYIENNRFPN
jgi:hypothetical protein